MHTYNMNFSPAPGTSPENARLFAALEQAWNGSRGGNAIFFAKKMIESALQAGATPNDAVNTEGRPLLHFAIYHDFWDLLVLLLEHRADPRKVKEGEGLTAEDFCSSSKPKRLLELYRLAYDIPPLLAQGKIPEILNLIKDLNINEQLAQYILVSYSKHCRKLDSEAQVKPK